MTTHGSTVGRRTRDTRCRSKDVRQALNYSINKETIQNKLYGGPSIFTIKGLGFITPSVMGYTDGLDPFPFDPDKARQLLADAGYPGGAGFPITVKLNAAPSGVIPFLVETAQFVAASWEKELSIEAEVVTHDYNAMKKLRRTDEIDGEIILLPESHLGRPGIQRVPLLWLRRGGQATGSQHGAAAAGSGRHLRG